MDRTTLNSILSEYARHLQAELRLTPPTGERYAALAKGLLIQAQADPSALFLPPVWTLAHLNRRAVEAYLNALQAQRGWQPMSRAYYITALSAFFRFLKARHHIARNPCARMRPALSGTPHPLPAGEAEAVLRLLAAPAPTLDAARQQLLVELLYGAGLRPIQAYRIAALEPQPRTGSARVRIGEAWQELPLSPEGLARAGRYLALRAGLLADPENADAEPAEAFWLDWRGRACSPARLARQVSRAMLAEGLSGGPASLRKLAARHFAEAGGDVRSMQHLLQARRLGQLDRFQPPPDLKRIADQFRRAHPRQETR